MRPTTPPTAAPAIAPVDMDLELVVEGSSKMESEARDAGNWELVVEDCDVDGEGVGVGDGDGVGQPIMEGEVRAQPSMGWAYAWAPDVDALKTWLDVSPSVS